MSISSQLSQFGWVLPTYQKKNFSNIISKIKHSFLSGNKNVFFFLIDGFGWSFYEKFEKLPFFKYLLEKGTVEKFTAQFPSTTAAHITFLNTNLTPQESGVFEWFYYEPKVDNVIAPLLFSFAGDRKTDTLKSHSEPQDIYPHKSIYEELNQLGIDSYVFLQKEISHSTYSSMMLSGAHIQPFNNLKEGLSLLNTIQKRQTLKPNYFFFYFGDIDSMGHVKGIHSPEFEKTVISCFEDLYEEIPLLRDGQLYLTADHGMIEVNPQTTFYLNEKMPHLFPYMKKNKEGHLIAPAGSCRDFFLYIQEPYIEKVKAELSEVLKDIAKVFLTKDLLAEGFFGRGLVSKDFEKRVGNIVILPFAKKSVWWREKGRFEQHFLAAHGGLTPEEMHIPFFSLKV